MEKVVIYPSRSRLLGAMLLSAAFVAVGAWFSLLDVHFAEERPLGRLFLLVVATPLFSVCFVFTLFRLVVRAPALVLDEEGIYDAGSLFAAGAIPWSDVRDVVVSEFQGHMFLGIVPVDVERFLAERSAVTRWWMRRNMDLGTPPVVIPQSLLSMEVEPLRARILRALEESRGH
jgi:hypothetical protein